MAAKRGAFIVIEGADGSGKGTQFQLLKERLTQAGYHVEAFDFPQYDQPSSYFVTQYLNGMYGTAEAVGPYTASLFYALDRYEAAPRIREAIEAGKIVLCNRYTGSNMAHQGTKFRNAEERRGYFIWLDNLEFEMLHIPRPDLSFVLRVPPEFADELIDKKGKRTYTNQKRDLHEADKHHQQRAVEVYDDLTRLFPRDFQRIDCVRGEKLLDTETIHAMLWEKILPLLPQPGQLEMPMPTLATPEEKAAAATVGVSGTGTEEASAATPAAETTETPQKTGADPEDAITDPNGNIYAFTSALDPAVVTAVAASLGQGGGELSIRVLQEFATAAQQDSEVLRRTIRSYGNESVRQLISSHVVAAGVSGLLAGIIEQGRLAAYVEPRQHRLHYEQKDSNGMYRYYMPLSLEGEIALQYRTHLDRIFMLYGKMLPVLAAHMHEHSGVPRQGRSPQWQAAMLHEARDILQAVLPLAATTTVAVYASAQSFESLIVRLASHTLPEANKTGAGILAQLRKTIPAFMEEADQPDRGGSAAAYRRAIHDSMTALTAAHLPAPHAAEAAAVTLTDVWPRNELDLVADMLYDYTTLPLRAIQTAVAAWPYARKLETFEAYMGERLNRRERPGRALEKAHYSWDLVCEYATLHELRRHRLVDDLAVQALTPRYGYEVPAAIEAAGLSDDFEECFDISLKLYSLLQQAGHTETAQYATLRGHKQRWKATYNAREAFHIHELRTSPHVSEAVRSFVEQLHAHLANVHPLIGEAMQFVGQGEDPELNRLAADRYAQFRQ